MNRAGKRKKFLIEVKVGQIWQDYDKRFRSQTPVYKKIVAIDGQFAICHGYRNGLLISKSRIRIDRFKPTSTGYILTDMKIEEV